MKDSEVHAALVGWLRGILKCEVIQAYQSGPEPTKPYVMVNYTGSVEVREHPQDIDYEEDADTNVTAIPIIEIEWRFSVHCYGEDPTDILRPVVSAVKLAQIIEPLTIHDVSQVRHLQDKGENEIWQPRAQIDMMLRGLTRDGFVIDVIDDISFNHDRQRNA